MTDPDVSLSGRVAAVTGAGAGLGRAEALALAAAGARVVLNDLDAAAAHAVAEEIVKNGGEAAVQPGDIGAWETGEALLRTAIGTFGGLDVLVNNAGFTRDRMLFNMAEEEWDTVLRVHLKGHFITSRLAVAHWRARSKSAGAPVYARIVNTASEAFLLGSSGQPNYAAAKAGIAALTLSTAQACGRYGVRANAICPRARTDMTAQVFGPPPQDRPDPLSVDHVTPLVVYLASPAAEDVTGQVFVAYGGRIAVMAPPTVAHQVTAEDAGTGSTTGSTTGSGGWTAAGLARELGPLVSTGTAGFTAAGPLAAAFGDDA